MPPDSVTPIAIGTAARAAAAMERGVVDAGIVTDFTIRYLERRFGQVRLLSDTRTRDGVQKTHGVNAFPGTVLMAGVA
jgi:NitT/TauT family transport system substrate-binding protein